MLRLIVGPRYVMHSGDMSTETTLILEGLVADLALERQSIIINGVVV